MTLLAQAIKMQGASWSSSSVRLNCHLKCCITAIYSPDSSSTSTNQSSPDFYQFWNKVPPFDHHNSNNSPQFIFQTSALCFFFPPGPTPLFRVLVLYQRLHLSKFSLSAWTARTSWNAWWFVATTYRQLIWGLYRSVQHVSTLWANTASCWRINGFRYKVSVFKVRH